MIIIESLNIGLPKKEMFFGKEIVTGICKMPVTGPLPLDELGFSGDGVGDPKNHGGRDKAVCVYGKDHYRYWEEVLGIKLPDAAFGENLSTSNLLESDVCIGDIFEVGTAIVQVTQPRQPCKTLAMRYNRHDIVKLIVDSGRTGFYLRVLEKGIVGRNSHFALKERDPHGITVAFTNLIYHHDRTNCEGIKKVIEITSLSESWRNSFNELNKKCK